MNSHEQPKQPNKRLRSDKENMTFSTSLAEPTTKRRSFFSEEKEKEMALFSKIRSLDTSLRDPKNLRYEWLLGARLTSIDFVTTDHDEAGRKDRIISNPALKYLSTIIHRLSEIVTKDIDAIYEYLIESMNPNTAQNKQHVIFLANIFMQFKQNIDRIHLLTDETRIFENKDYTAYTNKVKKQDYNWKEYTDELKQKCNWIAYFRYVIETAFKKMGGSEKDLYALRLLTNGMHRLQGLVYDSLKQNFPDISNQYTALENKKFDMNRIQQTFFANQQQKKRAAQLQQTADNTQTAAPSLTNG